MIVGCGSAHSRRAPASAFKDTSPARGALGCLLAVYVGRAAHDRTLMTGPLPSARLPFHGVPVGSDLGRGPMGLQGDWVHQPAVRVRGRARSQRGGQPDPQPGGPTQAATTTGAQAATAILEKRGWSEWWRWPAEALNRGCAHVHTCRVVSAPTLGRCPSRACDSTLARTPTSGYAGQWGVC